MNRKQFTILLVLVVILGAAGLTVYKKQNRERKGGEAAIGQKLLPEFPLNDVAQISIKHDTNQLNLAKGEDIWRVKERNNYPANFSSISDFLMKVHDLKVVQVEQIGPSQLPRLELAAGQGTNSPTVVEFKDKSGKNLQTLLLGKKHMRKSNRPSPMGDFGDDPGWPDGRYVKAGDAGTVALISEPFANIEPKPESWVNKDWFKVEKVRAISVDFPETTNSWKLSRETESGQWALADAKDGEQLDTSKVSSFSSALSSPSFSDVKTDCKPEDLGLDKPTSVSLETFDNFVYNIKVGQKTNDQYPLLVSVSATLPKERAPGQDEKPEDKEKLDKEFKEKQTKLEEKLANEKAYESWTYLVSSWTVDSLLKNRSELLQEKKEEPAAADQKSGASADAPDAASSIVPAELFSPSATKE